MVRFQKRSAAPAAALRSRLRPARAASCVRQKVPPTSGWPIPRDFLSGLGGVGELHSVFLRVVTGVADPRTWNGLRQEAPPTSGCPIPRISCKAWRGQRTSCGFPCRKPHTRPPMGLRSRKSGVLCVLCKGWDTRTLVSRFLDPTLRKMREGWGTRRLVALPAEDRFMSRGSATPVTTLSDSAFVLINRTGRQPLT